MLLPLLYAELFKVRPSAESLFLRSVGKNQTKRNAGKEKMYSKKLSRLQPTQLAEVSLWLGPQLRRVLVGQPSSFSEAEKKLLVFSKLEEARWLIWLCQLLPWVKGVALTGSLAALDPKSATDDLDLLVVCAAQRLWLVRPLLVLFSKIYGRRRTWNREEPNSWCFNMWLETSALAVSKKARNYYVANEVCQARWLVNKDETGEWFLAENRWAAEWLPRLYAVAKLQASLVSTWGSSLLAPPPLSWLLSLLNYVSYQLQLTYMSPHRTTETITYSSALFHTNASNSSARVIAQRSPRPVSS